MITASFFVVFGLGLSADASNLRLRTENEVCGPRATITLELQIRNNGKKPVAICQINRVDNRLPNGYPLDRYVEAQIRLTCLDHVSPPLGIISVSAGGELIGDLRRQELRPGERMSKTVVIPEPLKPGLSQEVGKKRSAKLNGTKNTGIASLQGKVKALFLREEGLQSTRQVHKGLNSSKVRR